jgi:hypothetical protein
MKCNFPVNQKKVVNQEYPIIMDSCRRNTFECCLYILNSIHKKKTRALVYSTDDNNNNNNNII